MGKLTGICKYCEKEFTKVLSRKRIAESNVHYCNRKCQAADRKNIGLGGWKHSDKTKGKMSASAKRRIKENPMPFGEASPGYKHGLVAVQQNIRASKKNLAWRKEVFSRDGYMCKSCGDDEYIHAHHIKLFSVIIMENNIQTMGEANLCKELWDVNNGVTLCPDCHKEAHSNIGRII